MEDCIIKHPWDSFNNYFPLLVFIPNDRKKYSVGENTGMKLDKNGGLDIYIAVEKPRVALEENWLPINRQNEDGDPLENLDLAFMSMAEIR